MAPFAAGRLELVELDRGLPEPPVVLPRRAVDLFPPREPFFLDELEVFAVFAVPLPEPLFEAPPLWGLPFAPPLVAPLLFVAFSVRVELPPPFDVRLAMLHTVSPPDLSRHTTDNTHNGSTCTVPVVSGSTHVLPEAETAAPNRVRS